MEWQKGPNLSSRWLLLSFNFLFFFASTVYLIIFSEEILADKSYFPFSDWDDLRENKEHRQTIITDIVSSENFAVSHNRHAVKTNNLLQICMKVSLSN